MSEALAGKSILIVGASAGLGQAMAEAAARRGAYLTLAARRLDRLEEIRATLDGEVTVVPCDVTEEGSCSRVVDQAVARFGRLDVLVYSAGCSPLGAMIETPVAKWKAVFEVNTIGAAVTMAAAAPHLCRSRGRAFFISSASARDLKDGLIPYSASKRALEAVVDGFRLEVPEVAYTTIIVASTGSTEFTRDWDPGTLARYIELWRAKGLLTKGAFASEIAFAELVTAVMSADIAVPELVVGPFPVGG
jgi:NADP-dependent 3-hydroxy acid dehydrogenase YdfG